MDGLNLWLIAAIILVPTTIVTALFILQIIRKAGYHPIWLIPALVPGLNYLLLWAFALSNWPNLIANRPDDLYRVALKQLSQGKVKQAIKHLNLLAEDDHQDAQYQLVDIYINGPDIEPSLKHAVYWSEKLAKKGDETMQFVTGDLYSRDDNPVYDIEKAEFWLEKAIRCRHVGAHRRLAEVYEQVPSEQCQRKKVIDLYLFSAGYGDGLSQSRLFDIFSDHNSEYYDPGKALRWLKVQAESGNPELQYHLGLSMINGDFVPLTMEDMWSDNGYLADAWIWISRAAEQGHHRAKAWLAEMEEKSVHLRDNRIDFSWDKNASVDSFSEALTQDLATGDVDGERVDELALAEPSKEAVHGG